MWCTDLIRYVAVSYTHLDVYKRQQPFLNLEDITLPAPYKMQLTTGSSALSINFMQLRIQLATLQTKIFQKLYVSGSVNKVSFLEIERELSVLSTQITNMKSHPIFDEELFYRSKVLMLELSCLKAHNAFLLYRPNLLQKKSLHAVDAAKHIIMEVWSHYTCLLYTSHLELAHVSVLEEILLNF